MMKTIHFVEGGRDLALDADVPVRDAGCRIAGGGNFGRLLRLLFSWVALLLVSSCEEQDDKEDEEEGTGRG